MILANVKTPNVYTDININTQRTGLLPNHQRVLFITNDSLGFPVQGIEVPFPIGHHELVEDERVDAPIPVGGPDRAIIPTPRFISDFVQDIYDTQSADEIFGKNSLAGRMMKAAVKTNRLVNVQATGGEYFQQEQIIAS